MNCSLGFRASLHGPRNVRHTVWWLLFDRKSDTKYIVIRYDGFVDIYIYIYVIIIGIARQLDSH